MKIYATPMKIPAMHKLFHYMKYLNVGHATDINDPDVKLIMHYNYSLDAIFTLPDRLKNVDAVNKNNINVRKDVIEGVFTDIFGYTSSINPLTYKGSFIEKSKRNAVHDGKIYQSPIPETKKGKIYQKLIDTRISHDTLKDVRVVIMKDEIPQVFIKEFSVNSMFTHGPNSTKARIANSNSELSKDEIMNILEFANRLGVDYGELDVLRSNETERIYIVDVNPTPGVNLLNMVKDSKEIMAEHFKRIFL